MPVVKSEAMFKKIGVMRRVFHQDRYIVRDKQRTADAGGKLRVTFCVLAAFVKQLAFSDKMFEMNVINGAMPDRTDRPEHLAVPKGHYFPKSVRIRETGIDRPVQFFELGRTKLVGVKLTVRDKAHPPCDKIKDL